jgi:putative transposase
VTEQAERFVSDTSGREHSPALVMHDRDTKFTKEFTEALNRQGVGTNPLPKASPNLNGRCERFIETIKLECLQKFIVFGKKHLDHLVGEFVDYYNHHRSHMERDHLPPVRVEPDEVETIPLEEIQVKSFVGGLVKAFERKAA